MWAGYDRLLNDIEKFADIPIMDYGMGTKFTYVRTKNSLGISKTNASQRFKQKIPLKMEYRISDFISGITSWNYSEASLALAAINAILNQPDTEWCTGKQSRDYTSSRFGEVKLLSYSVHDHGKHLSELIGKRKVLMVEGVTYEDSRYRNICKLSVIKEEPLQGDYPTTALEYLIHENSFIYLSGTCLVNKTIERILTISKAKQVILDGIDVPIAPLLLSEGVTRLVGFIVDDIDRCITYIKQGYGEEQLLDCGHMCDISEGEVEVE